MLENVEPEQTRRFLQQWIHHIHTNRPELVEELIEKTELTDSIQEGFNEEIARFTRTSV